MTQSPIATKKAMSRSGNPEQVLNERNKAGGLNFNKSTAAVEEYDTDTD